MNFSKTSKTLLIAGIVYLAFAVYGSIVPLNFQYRPLAEVWREFGNIRYLHFAPGYLADWLEDVRFYIDWIENILLFIPLGFIGLGILWHSKKIFLRILASATVLALSMGLSFVIEFLQLYFPPRTVALHDVIAEGIGAMIGMTLWWLTGPPLMNRIVMWWESSDRHGLAKRAFCFYLFFLLICTLFPFDLVLSLAGIYHKWKAGRVILMPFDFASIDPAARFFSLLTTGILWIPLGFLWKYVTRQDSISIGLCVFFTAGLFEFLQLFVNSRLSDVTDILAAALGAGIGITAVHLRSGIEFLSAPRIPDSSRHHSWFLPWVATLLAWLAILVLAFWYPFNFSADVQFVRAQRQTFADLSFISVEIFLKLAFFLPLGALLALPALHIPRGIRRHLWNLGVCFVIALMALGIELGQLLLPNRNPTVLQWFLDTAGGFTGYLLMILLTPHLPYHTKMPS